MEPGTYYACSVFIKPLNRTKISLEASSVSVALTSARFNLATGASGGHLRNPVPPMLYMEAHAHGFFRCVMIFAPAH